MKSPTCPHGALVPRQSSGDGLPQHPADSGRRADRADRRRAVVCRVAGSSRAARRQERVDARPPVRGGGRGRRRCRSPGASRMGARLDRTLADGPRRQLQRRGSPPERPASAIVVLSRNGQGEHQAPARRAAPPRVCRRLDRAGRRTDRVAHRDGGADAREAVYRPRVHAVVRRSHQGAQPIVLQRDGVREQGQGCGVPRAPATTVCRQKAAARLPPPLFHACA